MKNLTELLTPEQKKEFENCFFINDDNELICIMSNANLSIENFKVFIKNGDKIMIATAEDISYYSPECKDFDFSVCDTYFWRAGTPDDVLIMLDEYLGKDKYDVKDDENNDENNDENEDENDTDNE